MLQQNEMKLMSCPLLMNVDIICERTAVGIREMMLKRIREKLTNYFCIHVRIVRFEQIFSSSLVSKCVALAHNSWVVRIIAQFLWVEKRWVFSSASYILLLILIFISNPLCFFKLYKFFDLLRRCKKRLFVFSQSTVYKEESCLLWSLRQLY
jgi:hypothetical protein